MGVLVRRSGTPTFWLALKVGVLVRGAVKPLHGGRYPSILERVGIEENRRGAQQAAGSINPIRVASYADPFPS